MGTTHSDCLPFQGTRSASGSFADVALHVQPHAPKNPDLLCDLVKTHRQKLYGFVKKQISNSADAEDITQQAFVLALENLEYFKGHSELSTWVYGIALNLVRNHLSRSPSRRYVFESESALAEFHAQTPGPAEQYMLTHTVQALQIAMDQLPAPMRQVLFKVSLDEMGYENIASDLGVPIGTVRSRISRAREFLRKTVQKKYMD